jgi:hypothetical protein
MSTVNGGLGRVRGEGLASNAGILLRKEQTRSAAFRIESSSWALPRYEFNLFIYKSN